MYCNIFDSFCLKKYTSKEKKEPMVIENSIFKQILRNIKNNEAHFNLITYWENIGVIKNFAGQDFEKAKYYPEDDNFLLEFEEKVQHYEVFAAI